MSVDGSADRIDRGFDDDDDDDDGSLVSCSWIEICETEIVEFDEAALERRETRGERALTSSALPSSSSSDRTWL
jgi:hypothetical protein